MSEGLTPLQIEDDLEGKFSQINQHWQQKKRHFYQQKEITFLGSGLSWGLAISGEQFTFLRPTDSCDSPSTGRILSFITLTSGWCRSALYFTTSHILRVPHFYLATQKAIVEQGATAELISFIPDASESNNLFLVMQWLYEMCWHLSCDYVDAGGQRVSHREK